MADAVEAAGQHVQQEAPDELVCVERHDLLALGAGRLSNIRVAG